MGCDEFIIWDASVIPEATIVDTPVMFDDHGLKLLKK